MAQELASKVIGGIGILMMIGGFAGTIIQGVNLSSNLADLQDSIDKMNTACSSLQKQWAQIYKIEKAQIQELIQLLKPLNAEIDSNAFSMKAAQQNYANNMSLYKFFSSSIVSILFLMFICKYLLSPQMIKKY